jgi:hypothetical protein
MPIEEVLQIRTRELLERVPSDGDDDHPEHDDPRYPDIVPAVHESQLILLHDRDAGMRHDPLVIDKLRAAADALNRGDPGPFTDLIAPECEWRGIPQGHLWWKRTPS